MPPPGAVAPAGAPAAPAPPATKVMLRHLPPAVTEDAVVELLARALPPTVKASIVYLEKGKTKCVRHSCRAPGGRD
jgi:hypothetical protein